MSGSRAMRRRDARAAAVLWDMDGTLVDTEPYWIECEHELVAAHHGTWNDEKAHSIVGMDLRDAASFIAEHGPVDLPIDEIVNRLLDGVIARVHERVPWRPGARELLAELKGDGVPCALVTMSWRRCADAVLAELPAGAFDVVVAGDEVTHGKPHPQPYLVAAEQLGVRARDCVALEDSPTGVRSAVAARCTVFAIPNVVPIAPGPGYTVVPSLTALDAHGLGAAASRSRRRRSTLLGGIVALLLIVGGGVLALGRHHRAPPPPDIALDGWAPYWTLDASTSSVSRHGGQLRDVSPFWFTAMDATTITMPPTLSAEAAGAFVRAVRANGSRVVPSIVDGMGPMGMATVLADPQQRAAHVATIVALVQDQGFDGIDVDYESFAFVDGSSTWAATRPNWVAFVGALAAALHAHGKTITISAPAIYDDARTDSSGYWVYDYRALGTLVDRIRIMAYDWSTSTPGPVAPLAFVERAIAGAERAVPDRSKLVLGVALHGYNWPVSTTGSCPAGSDSAKTSVSQAGVADLLRRRGATAVFDPITGESSFTYSVTFSDPSTSCTQVREVHYVDAQGSRERIDLARRDRLGGASLWALGYDSDDTWAAIGTLARPNPAAVDAVVGTSAERTSA